MDKYTVDLDKVLNDFEYNELAIEQDNIATSSVSRTIPHAYPSGSRLKTAGTTKHSINTVFKSLDDYVNSDIPATNSMVPEYKLKEDNKSLVLPAESNLLVDISSQPQGQKFPSIKLPKFNVPEGDNNITEGLNLEISSQEEIVFDKKIVLEDVEVDNSDSDSTDSVYLDMSAGSKNVILNNNFEEDTPQTINNIKDNNPKKEEEKDPAPVGFGNIVDIDESVLSQYLEDLQQEIDIPKEEVKKGTLELHQKIAEEVKKPVNDLKLKVEKMEISAEKIDENEKKKHGHKKKKEHTSDSSQHRPSHLDIVNNLVPTRECINLIGKGKY